MLGDAAEQKFLKRYHHNTEFLFTGFAKDITGVKSQAIKS
jgi:hypothetical protein